MRSSRVLTAVAFTSAAAIGFIAGCQSYDFEPVTPLVVVVERNERNVQAKSLKPNLMLLVDKSGSMDLPSDPSDPDCALSDGGTCGFNPACNTATCPTRWSELRGAMGVFLSTSGDVAHMGLSIFPGNASCGQVGLPDGGFDMSQASVQLLAVDQSADDNPLAMQASADAINSQIQTMTRAGGTPTGLAVKQISVVPELNRDDGREDFLLVLTDGLPNCNPSNEFNGGQAQCRCTVPSCGPAGPPPGFFYTAGCLDENGTIAEIAAARGRGVRTIVVGFGAETAAAVGTNTTPKQVLNGMATAGGFLRECDADGGGCAPLDTCDSNSQCVDIKYYNALSQSELVTALQNIAGIIDAQPCEYQISLNPPDNDPRYIVVYITPSGEPTQTLHFGSPDSFSYVPGTVNLIGAACTTVEASTPAKPVKVEIAIVSTL